MKLEHDDLFTTTEALRIAAKAYEADAATLREPPTEPTWLRMAEQFDRQAKAAWDLKNRIDAAEAATNHEED